MARQFTILVTGSRTWTDRLQIHNALVAQWMKWGMPKGVVVIHGNAKGADKIAHKVAKKLGFTPRPRFAQWRKYKKQAGFLRNCAMVEHCATLDPLGTVCLAFIRDESPGASQCADYAEKHHIETVRFTKHGRGY